MHDTNGYQDERCYWSRAVACVNVANNDVYIFQRAELPTLAITLWSVGGPVNFESAKANSEISHCCYEVYAMLVAFRC